MKCEFINVAPGGILQLRVTAEDQNETTLVELYHEQAKKNGMSIPLFMCTDGKLQMGITARMPGSPE